jgi:hypothetical protein
LIENLTINKKSCQKDYLKITDNTGEFISCGFERTFYNNKFCSNVVYVSYNRLDTLGSTYRGFKLYYESNHKLILKIEKKIIE